MPVTPLIAPLGITAPELLVLGLALAAILLYSIARLARKDGSDV